MPFNPPPNWPEFPPGWTPPPDWSPHPAWPPAPPGWQFWTPDEPPVTPGPPAPPVPAEPTPPGGGRISPYLAGAAAFAAVVLIGGGAFAAWHFTSRPASDAPPRPDSAAASTPASERTPVESLTFVPQHPALTDFATWLPFGGIDADVSADGLAVVLDTHDTTDTWTTKWSGIAMPGPASCSLSIAGRVRDISHATGVPGGYGLGLATVDGSAGSEVLTGSALQYDFGQQGFRLARYPDDSDTGLIPAPVDNEWHTFLLRIEQSGSVTFKLDGVAVVDDRLEPACGQPVIRVWAGAAEFADLEIDRGPG
ncbi:hypothetical protein [Mycolicibacterium sp.]|uniref:hypothetical protein n=1 Tax=Mycolicibacterium sp. TaxID=2320850 RepID=UPI003D0E6A0D